MTKVPLGNLIKILAPYFNYLYGQKCIRVLSSMQSFGKKYQSVHQQIKVKYIEEEEEVTLPMHAIYVCFASQIPLYFYRELIMPYVITLLNFEFMRARRLR